MDPATVVQAFFERMEARDWRQAGALLASNLHIEFSATGEHFDGPHYLAMNEAYPEGWSIEVAEVLGAGDRVAAQLRVRHGTDTFWCAGFYTVIDGVIFSGVEHWVTERSEAIPDWRLKFGTPET